jgi:hypothetical protein
MEQAGFHPTFSMMWAGSKLANSICQSAKGAWNTTVTVRPLLVPVTDEMSRYPAVLATVVESAAGSPRCCSQAYAKSAAVMGTPSDQTARWFSV